MLSIRTRLDQNGRMAQADQTAAEVGEPGSDRRLLWTYTQLRQVEVHWTQQVQNQQTRITTTLTVNGILLAFIAGSGLLTQKFDHHRAQADLLVASICCLAMGLIAGLVALIPVTKIGGKPLEGAEETKERKKKKQKEKQKRGAEFISVPFLLEQSGSNPPALPDQDAAKCTTELLTILNMSFSTESLRKTLQRRRVCLWVQLVALIGAVVLLTIALSELVLPA